MRPRQPAVILLLALFFVVPRIEGSSCLDPHKDAAKEIKVVKTVVRDTQFPYPEILGQILSYRGQRWRLINIGQRQEDADRSHITDRFRATESRMSRRGQSPFTHANEIHFDGAIKRAQDFLDLTRKFIYERVYATYQKMKEYVATTWDVNLLRSSDYSEWRYDDTLVLIPESIGPITSLRPQEIGENALMTMSMVPGRAKILRRPSPYDNFPYPNQLPFLERMEMLPVYPEVPSVLKNLLEGNNCAEISRYVMFQEGIPRPVVAKLMLHMLNLAANLDHPIKVFFASVDPRTSAAFRRFYHFKRLDGVVIKPMPHPTTQSTTQVNLEELIFMEVGSPDYHRFVRELRESALEVDATPSEP